MAVVAETEVMEEAAGEEVLEASNNSLTSRLSWPPASSIPQINCLYAANIVNANLSHNDPYHGESKSQCNFKIWHIIFYNYANLREIPKSGTTYYKNFFFREIDCTFVLFFRALWMLMVLLMVVLHFHLAPHPQRRRPRRPPAPIHREQPRWHARHVLLFPIIVANKKMEWFYSKSL